MTNALRYSPSLESLEENERQTTDELVEAMRGIIDTTWKDTGHAYRSVHAKSHALLEGEMSVLGNLPAELAQGMFAKPAIYPVVMRISTNPGDILPDSVSVPRGLAVKVIGVDGERLSGSEGKRTQDFLMVNGPVFGAPDAKSFLKTVKLVAKTTDILPGAKQILSAALRGIEHVVEAVGGASGTIKALGGHPMTNPLGETYYSQTSFRYGDYVAKFAVAPVSVNLTQLHNAALDVRGKPDGIREAMLDFFRIHSGEWELRVQLCTNLESMPVEDSSKQWPEAESPYVAVARIHVGQQRAWSEARSAIVDDAMTFDPWQGLEAHRPLGSVNRARKPAYKMSGDFRATHSGCPMQHPTARVDLPEN